MSVFDLIIFVVMIALTLWGLWKGAVSQIVSVGSLIVCWIVASRFAFVIAPSIPAEAPWNKIGAMIVLFGITMIAIRLVHGVIEKKLKDWGLGGLNKTLGGGLGFVKAVLVCMVLTFFGVTLSVATREMVFQSKTGNHLAHLITRTGTLIPEDSCELLRAQIDLFNATVAKTPDANSNAANDAENTYMQQMLTAVNKDDSASNAATYATSRSKLGDYLARTSAVVGEIQNLRDDLADGFVRDQSQAASLLDAIGQWWNGDEDDDTPKQELATSKETVKEAVLETPTATSAHANTVKTASVPLTTTEETLFRSDVPKTFSPPSVQALAEFLPQADAIPAETMDIPHTSAPFRLRPPASRQQSTDRLLRSTQSSRSAKPASVFSQR